MRTATDEMKKMSLSSRALTPCAALLMLAALLVSACGEGVELEKRNDPAPVQTDTEQTEVLNFTTTPYDFTGETPIARIRDFFPDGAIVWHGFESGLEYPVPDDCQPSRTGDYVPATVAQLPVTIEGIVTLHPRFYQKRSICDSEERFYGSYIIQDSSGGIVVLKDSRVADFSFGDRVRLRVRGIMVNQFPGSGPFYAVQLFDQEEVVKLGNEMYYEEIARGFTNDDIGVVKRVRGKVITVPTNNNFGEMILQHPTDSSITWAASLDSELSRRRPNLNIGDEVEMTGPVLDNFGLRIMLASFGQIRNITRESSSN